MNINDSGIVFCILIFLSLVIVPSVAMAAKYNATMLNDSHVTENSPDSSWGQYHYLEMYGQGGLQEISYLQFNVSGTGEIKEAYLHLRTYGFVSSDVNTSVHYSSDDDWGEDSITWNNKPYFNTTVWDWKNMATEGWYEFDVTDILKQEYAGDGIITLVLNESDYDGPDSVIAFNSSEGTETGRPYLEIDNKTESDLSLTATSWSINEGTEAVITCNATTNVTLLKDGVVVSNPYSSILSYGSYNFTCYTDDSYNYTPTTTQNTLVVGSSGFGCTNTDTYAFQKTVSSVSGTRLNLNFTDLVASSYVRNDLADVWVNSSVVPDAWTNFTDGTYLVVNVTGISSFIVKFGNYIGNQSHTNETKSDNTTAMTGYSEINDYSFFTFMNEKTASSWIPSDTNNTLSLYCDDGESSFSFNDTQLLVATVQQLDEAKANVEYTSSYYYRNLLFTSGVEYRNMWLVDANTNTVDQIVVTLKDLTGNFKGSELKIKKNIEGNLETITELNFDAENKAIVYLIDGDKYTVTVDSGTEERTIGYLYADSSDLSKTLIIGAINFTDLTPGNVSLTLSFNSIDLYWYDPSGKTNSVSMWVYNSSTNELIDSASSSNASSIHFSIEVPDENATYKVRYEVDHQDMGIWSATVFMSGTGSRTILTDFPLTTLISGLGGDVNIWLSFLLILPLPLMFTRRFAPMGALILVGFVWILSYWGVIPMSTTSILLPMSFMVAGFMFIRWISRRD